MKKAINLNNFFSFFSFFLFTVVADSKTHERSRTRVTRKRRIFPRPEEEREKSLISSVEQKLSRDFRLTMAFQRDYL
jgi:hypothetical protein